MRLYLLCSAVIYVTALLNPTILIGESPSLLPYPQGIRFPLGLFALGVKDPAALENQRWNLGQSNTIDVRNPDKLASLLHELRSKGGIQGWTAFR